MEVLMVVLLEPGCHRLLQLDAPGPGASATEYSLSGPYVLMESTIGHNVINVVVLPYKAPNDLISLL